MRAALLAFATIVMGNATLQAQTCGFCLEDCDSSGCRHRYEMTLPPPYLNYDWATAHGDWVFGTCASEHTSCAAPFSEDGAQALLVLGHTTGQLGLVASILIHSSNGAISIDIETGRLLIGSCSARPMRHQIAGPPLETPSEPPERALVLASVRPIS